MYFRFDSIRFSGALLFVTSRIGHSFNAAFMNCESVTCFILRFIDTFSEAKVSDPGTSNKLGVSLSN